MTLDALRETVGTALMVAPETLEMDTRLDSLPDFDSVARLGLMLALEEAGVPVPMAKAQEIETFGDIARIARIDG